MRCPQPPLKLRPLHGVEKSPMRRVADVLKGLIALATTVGLVAGIPYLLVTLVGWPLPTEIPNWDTIERTITTTGIDQNIVIKTLAVVVWVTWAQLVWAIGVETVAAVRGSVARRVVTLPGIQVAAARLGGDRRSDHLQLRPRQTGRSPHPCLRSTPPLLPLRCWSSRTPTLPSPSPRSSPPRKRLLTPPMVPPTG